jgi:hypothetical protein
VDTGFPKNDTRKSRIESASGFNPNRDALSYLEPQRRRGGQALLYRSKFCASPSI